MNPLHVADISTLAGRFNTLITWEIQDYFEWQGKTWFGIRIIIPDGRTPDEHLAKRERIANICKHQGFTNLDPFIVTKEIGWDLWAKPC